MEEKIPCIKCNTEMWECIKVYLNEWGYHYSRISINSDFDSLPLLVINWCGNLGDVSNLSIGTLELNNRELVTNVEEFLEKAAKLKGFTYKRKDIDLINRTKLPLKVGDKVIFRGDKEVHTILGYYFYKGFNNYENNYGYVLDKPIIYKGHNGSKYGYNQNGTHYKGFFNCFYTSHQFVKPINKEDNMKEINFDFLEVGMVVEYKSGERRLVLSNTKGRIFLSGIIDWSYIDQDSEDIVKVYKIRHRDNLSHLLEDINLTIVWEKPKEVELTMQEIADKFGIPVEQLKIKK